MQIKIVSLENEMDMRVESLIAEIHKCRDEYMAKLRSYKAELETWGSVSLYLIEWLIFMISNDNRMIKSSNAIDNLKKEGEENNE